MVAMLFCLMVLSFFGVPGKAKQDCEINAAKRVIPRLAKQHPHMAMVVVADGLFSKLPLIKCIESARMEYILVAKPADHKNIEEMVNIGRSRWQIENQVFDLLKNHGHHLNTTSATEKTTWLLTS